MDVLTSALRLFLDSLELAAPVTVIVTSLVALILWWLSLRMRLREHQIAGLKRMLVELRSHAADVFGNETRVTVFRKEHQRLNPIAYDRPATSEERRFESFGADLAAQAQEQAQLLLMTTGQSPVAGGQREPQQARSFVAVPCHDQRGAVVGVIVVEGASSIDPNSPTFARLQEDLLRASLEGGKLLSSS
jgi:hypothetical protein